MMLNQSPWEKKFRLCELSASDIGALPHSLDQLRSVHLLTNISIKDDKKLPNYHLLFQFK